MKKPFALILMIALSFLASSAVAEYTNASSTLPLGLDTDVYLVPDDNPITPEKAELGKLLYFDKRISVDSTVSCASCHSPATGFADPNPTSKGVDGKTGNRNSPTVINTAFNLFQFWDGRAASLEEQAVGPMANPVEMAHTLEGVEKRIGAIEGYKQYFKAAFEDEQVTIDRIAKAIATYERTVLSGNSAYDKFVHGDKTALSDSAQRGLELFEGKALCTRCHVGFNFTDNIFHNIGVGMSATQPDLGRYVVTKEENDKGAFKTPTLRDISKTAPYMHDGSVQTLEEVIDFYNKGGEPNAWLDPKMEKLGLNDKQKKDLVEFLKSLDGDWKAPEEPSLPQ